MRMEKIAVPSQTELFIRNLQDKILSGELAAGEKLPPERELSAGMGISRTVVNTGIAVLVNQGFLEVVPRRGTFVADIESNGGLELFNATLSLRGDVLSDEDMRSILEVRWALERLTMKNAIEKMTEEDIRLLDQIVEEIRKAQTPLDAAEHAFAFHKELRRICDNRMLTLIFYSFKRPIILMWQRFVRIYGVETLYTHTKKSLDLIRERDYEGAIAWIDKFIQDATEGQYTLYSNDLIKRK